MTGVAEPEIAGRLRWQAEWCLRLGSPLYGDLLERAAADVEKGGPCRAALRGHEDDPLGSALPLRLMGAVHRLVLDGQAPELAAFYPSAGGSGTDPDRRWAAFADTVDRDDGRVRELVEHPVQTNEVGRAPALLGGFLLVAAETGLPLRLLEVGASAGLNLRFDRYAYDTAAGPIGDAGSEVRFEEPFEGGTPPVSTPLRIAERRGCDRSPLDPGSPQDRLTLVSYLWADQVNRIRQLRAALEIAAAVPAPVEQADAGEWATTALAAPASGTATVLFHSLVQQYFSPETEATFRAAVDRAADEATADAPFGWLRMEPANELADVRLTLWPGGEERLIARTGYHGPPVHWLA